MFAEIETNVPLTSINSQDRFKFVDKASATWLEKKHVKSVYLDSNFPSNATHSSGSNRLNPYAPDVGNDETAIPSQLQSRIHPRLNCLVTTLLGNSWVNEMVENNIESQWLIDSEDDGVIYRIALVSMNDLNLGGAIGTYLTIECFTQGSVCESNLTANISAIIAYDHTRRNIKK